MRGSAFRAALALAALVAATELGLALAPLARGPLSFDVGPSTGSYLIGFTESWEYSHVSARFAGRYAAIRLPLEATPGEAQVSLRYSRLEPGAIRSSLFLGERPALSFEALPARLSLGSWSRDGRRGSPFEEFHVVRGAAAVVDGAARLELVNRDPRRSPYALALDWVRIEGVGWRVPLRRLGPRALVAGAFLIAVAAGFGSGAAALLGGGVAAGVVAWASLDPFGLVHVSARVAGPGIALGIAAALLLRRRRSGRWAALILFVAYLVKAAGLFHPSYFYADVRTHRRYAMAFARAQGDLQQRGRTALRAAGMGLRTVGDETYTFPYSPLFYLPFTWLPQEAELLDESMKHVALAAATAEVALVFVVARIAFGAGAALFAALLAAFLPPMFSRLLLAMWPAVTAHLLECLALLAAVRLAARPARPVRLSAFTAASLVALLVYVGSPIVVGSYVVALAALDRRAGPRLIVGFAVAGAVSLALLYGEPTRALLGELAPRLWSAPGAGPGGPGALAALGRVGLFYGWVYPALALAGLLLVARGADPRAARALVAWVLAYLLLAALRAFGHGLFRDLKEILFVGPLIAVASGVSLARLAQQGRRGAISAAALAVGLVGFGLWRYAGYLGAVVQLADLHAR